MKKNVLPSNHFMWIYLIIVGNAKIYIKKLITNTGNTKKQCPIKVILSRIDNSVINLNYFDSEFLHLDFNWKMNFVHAEMIDMILILGACSKNCLIVIRVYW